jgi:hypothetical protein
LIYSTYFLEQKRDLLTVLQRQKGRIDYPVMEGTFYVRDFASGQTSYKARTLALLEYVLHGNTILIRENDTETEIASPEALAGYYRKKSQPSRRLPKRWRLIHCPGKDKKNNGC